MNIYACSGIAKSGESIINNAYMVAWLHTIWIGVLLLSRSVRKNYGKNPLEKPCRKSKDFSLYFVHIPLDSNPLWLILDGHEGFAKYVLIFTKCDHVGKLHPRIF